MSGPFLFRRISPKALKIATQQCRRKIANPILESIPFADGTIHDIGSGALGRPKLAWHLTRGPYFMDQKRRVNAGNTAIIHVKSSPGMLGAMVHFSVLYPSYPIIFIDIVFASARQCIFAFAFIAFQKPENIMHAVISFTIHLWKIKSFVPKMQAFVQLFRFRIVTGFMTACQSWPAVCLQAGRISPVKLDAKNRPR